MNDLGDEIELSELQSMPLIILMALALLSGLTGGFLVLEVYNLLSLQWAVRNPRGSDISASCLATITLPLLDMLGS